MCVRERIREKLWVRECMYTWQIYAICVVCSLTTAAAVLAVRRQDWWYNLLLYWTTPGSQWPLSQRWCRKSSLDHWNTNLSIFLCLNTETQPQEGEKQKSCSCTTFQKSVSVIILGRVRVYSISLVTSTSMKTKIMLNKIYTAAWQHILPSSWQLQGRLCLFQQDSPEHSASISII